MSGRAPAAPSRTEPPGGSVERDQHSGPEQGTGDGAAIPEREPAADPDAASSRPTRRTEQLPDRRRRVTSGAHASRRARRRSDAPAPTAGRATSTAPTHAPQRSRRAAPQPPSRAPPHAPPSKPRAPRRAAPPPAARSRPAPPPPRPRARRPPAPARATRRAGGSGAASLPRLAWTARPRRRSCRSRSAGRLTLRALDAVARGLRGS